MTLYFVVNYCERLGLLLLLLLRTFIIVIINLYGCETWSLTLREERILRVLRRMFGPKRNEIKRGVDETT
jgi:hypothetical protein